MPELPEVEVVARGLAARIAGLRVREVDLRRADIVHGHAGLLALPLRGRRVNRVRREGKLVHLRLSGELSLYVHLGMTGRLLVLPPDSPLESHTHLAIRFDDTSFELRFCDPRRFGGVWVMNGDSTAQWRGRRLPTIAADPLKLTLPKWRKLLCCGRQIKAFLMAQDPISGIGNIYCDEALHRAGIHPLTRACDLPSPEVDQLYRSVRRVLSDAIRAGGSSVNDYRDANNARGSFQKRHRVYDRAGQPCRRCRTPIERIVVAGRGTHLCPQCQTHCP